jgi:hypothetical protein
MKAFEKALIGTALPYWEVEAAIVRRFFKSKPKREDHIFWLKAQLWKELHPVDGATKPSVATSITRSSNSFDRSSITTC